MDEVNVMGNFAESDNTFTSCMNDPILFQLYQNGMRRPIRNDLIVPLTFIAYFSAITRFSLQNVGNEDGLFTASFFFFVLVSILFFPYLATRLVVHLTPSDKLHWSIYRRSVTFQHFAVKIHLQDAICIVSVIVNGLTLLARVYAGQCPSDSTLWTSQTCNPFADAGSIPFDQVMLTYLCPIVVQLVVRGISITALVFTWLLGVVFVATATAFVDSYQQTWSMVYSVYFFVIIFMIEGLTRTTFVQGQAMIAAYAESSKLELVFLELSSKVDKKLKEKEVYQLKSLMGNVAHDLKTPLHSIEADLEIIRIFISKIPKSALETACKSTDIIDIQSVISSLQANCSFIGTSINRSQDFIKSSNNITLLPLMETFELKSALEMPFTCINHLESGKLITLQPLTEDICPHIISDKHWLSENVLCLLSNAVKYSDDGSIDVTLKLIDVPAEDFVPTPFTTADEGEELEADEVRSTNTAKKNGPIYITMQRTNSIAREVDQTEITRPSSQDLGTKRMLIVTVEDNGIGIPVNKRAHLFQPFQQAQRMAGGTGLGLYSLAKRMEAIGGDCGVRDRADGGQGSMFWFSIPYRPDETRVETGSDDDSVDLSPTFLSKPQNILVIDDSLSVLKVTSRLLKMSGHTVTTAPNGSIGLKMLKHAFYTKDFDIVITDIQMPVMDGMEATRRYRDFEGEEMEREMKSITSSREGSCDTSRKYENSCTDGNDGDGEKLSKMKRSKKIIIGMSANSDSLTKQGALDCGMDYFVSKPFAYKDLLPIFKQIHSTKTMSAVDSNFREVQI